jgi:hypothetical protein
VFNERVVIVEINSLCITVLIFGFDSYPAYLHINTSISYD